MSTKSADQASQTDEEKRDDPEIADELVHEKLRIDGICGVY